MNQSHFRVVLLYVLTTVFLVVQGAPAHAHLPVHHQHSGSFHEHDTEAHAHRAALLHADPIVLEHGNENVAAVVDFDHEQSLPNCKTADNSPGATAGFVGTTPLILAGATHFPENCNSLPRHPPPHIGEPRAPPLRS